MRKAINFYVVNAAYFAPIKANAYMKIATTVESGVADKSSSHMDLQTHQLVTFKTDRNMALVGTGRSSLSNTRVE